MHQSAMYTKLNQIICAVLLQKTVLQEVIKFEIVSKTKQETVLAEAILL